MNMTLTEAWAIQCALVAARTNTSDFEEDEIRPLQSFNSKTEFMKWTGFTEKRDARHGDIGVSKQKENFMFRNGEWKPIK